MILHSLSLCNFRNYEEAHFRFSPTLNYIYGENGQGKTNLLEALALFFTGRSFRTRHLTDLIRFGSSGFYLEAHFEKNGVEQTLKFTFDGKSRTLIHNHTALSTLSALLGLLSGVILSPEDKELVRGQPSTRRQFLDIHLSQTDPLYLYHLNRYNRALKQRNHLLRRRKTVGIEAWEEELSKGASYLTQKRIETTQELANTLTDFELRYKSSYLTVEEFRIQYAKGRSRELDLGNTLTGPHRDDLQIFQKGKEAKTFASEGEARSAAAALRLAEWQRLKTFHEAPPLMCVDDLGISLDAKREESLYLELTRLGQVFLTSPRLDHNLPPGAHPLFISEGRLLEPTS